MQNTSWNVISIWFGVTNIMVETLQIMLKKGVKNPFSKYWSVYLTLSYR